MIKNVKEEVMSIEDLDNPLDAGKVIGSAARRIMNISRKTKMDSLNFNSLLSQPITYKEYRKLWANYYQSIVQYIPLNEDLLNKCIGLATEFLAAQPDNNKVPQEFYNGIVTGYTLKK